MLWWGTHWSPNHCKYSNTTTPFRAAEVLVLVPLFFFFCCCIDCIQRTNKCFLQSLREKYLHVGLFKGNASVAVSMKWWLRMHEYCEIYHKHAFSLTVLTATQNTDASTDSPLLCFGNSHGLYLRQVFGQTPTPASPLQRPISRACGALITKRWGIPSLMPSCGFCGGSKHTPGAFTGLWLMAFMLFFRVEDMSISGDQFK